LSFPHVMINLTQVADNEFSVPSKFFAGFGKNFGPKGTEGTTLYNKNPGSEQAPGIC